jgi:hypothetical protein
MLWLLVVVPVLVGLYVLAQRRSQRYALRRDSLKLPKDASGEGLGSAAIFLRRFFWPLLP